MTQARSSLHSRGTCSCSQMNVNVNVRMFIFDFFITTVIGFVLGFLMWRFLPCRQRPGRVQVRVQDAIQAKKDVSCV